METLQDFYLQSEDCVGIFDHFANRHNLVGRAESDHICYKCGSSESFEFIRSLFEEKSEYIHQSIISNRRIAIIALKQAINSALGPIKFLELSDQKPNGSQKEGFDHIEVYPVKMSYDEMVSELEKTEKIKKVERPHHTTHDIDMGDGYLFRCTQGPLIEKIKKEEMS